MKVAARLVKHIVLLFAELPVDCLDGLKVHCSNSDSCPVLWLETRITEDWNEDDPRTSAYIMPELLLEEESLDLNELESEYPERCVEFEYRRLLPLPNAFGEKRSGLLETTKIEGTEGGVRRNVVTIGAQRMHARVGGEPPDVLDLRRVVAWELEPVGASTSLYEDNIAAIVVFPEKKDVGSEDAGRTIVIATKIGALYRSYIPINPIQPDDGSISTQSDVLDPCGFVVSFFIFFAMQFPDLLCNYNLVISWRYVHMQRGEVISMVYLSPGRLVCLTDDHALVIIIVKEQGLCFTEHCLLGAAPLVDAVLLRQWGESPPRLMVLRAGTRLYSTGALSDVLDERTERKDDEVKAEHCWSLLYEKFRVSDTREDACARNNTNSTNTPLSLSNVYGAPGALLDFFRDPVPEILFESGPGEAEASTGLWALRRSHDDAHHATVILSSSNGTRALSSDGMSTTFSDATEALGLDWGSETLAAGTLQLDGWGAQITSKSVRAFILKLKRDDECENKGLQTELMWIPGGGAHVSAARVSDGRILVQTAAHGRHCLSIIDLLGNCSTEEPLELMETGSLTLSHEASCISNIVRCENVSLVALGTYGASILLIQLPFSSSGSRTSGRMPPLLVVTEFQIADWSYRNTGGTMNVNDGTRSQVAMAWQPGSPLAAASCKLDAAPGATLASSIVLSPAADLKTRNEHREQLEMWVATRDGEVRVIEWQGLDAGGGMQATMLPRVVVQGTVPPHLFPLPTMPGRVGPQFSVLAVSDSVTLLRRDPAGDGPDALRLHQCLPAQGATPLVLKPSDGGDEQLCLLVCRVDGSLALLSLEARARSYVLPVTLLPWRPTRLTQARDYDFPEALWEPEGMIIIAGASYRTGEDMCAFSLPEIAVVDVALRRIVADFGNDIQLIPNETVNGLVTIRPCSSYKFSIIAGTTIKSNEPSATAQGRIVVIGYTSKHALDMGDMGEKTTLEWLGEMRFAEPVTTVRLSAHRRDNVAMWFQTYKSTDELDEDDFEERVLYEFYAGVGHRLVQLFCASQADAAGYLRRGHWIRINQPIDAMCLHESNIPCRDSNGARSRGPGRQWIVGSAEGVAVYFPQSSKEKVDTHVLSGTIDGVGGAISVEVLQEAVGSNTDVVIALEAGNQGSVFFSQIPHNFQQPMFPGVMNNSEVTTRINIGEPGVRIMPAFTDERATFVTTGGAWWDVTFPHASRPVTTARLIQRAAASELKLFGVENNEAYDAFRFEKLREETGYPTRKVFAPNLLPLQRHEMESQEMGEDVDASPPAILFDPEVMLESLLDGVTSEADSMAVQQVIDGELLREFIRAPREVKQRIIEAAVRLGLEVGSEDRRMAELIMRDICELLEGEY